MSIISCSISDALFSSDTVSPPVIDFRPGRVLSRSSSVQGAGNEVPRVYLFQRISPSVQAGLASGQRAQTGNPARLMGLVTSPLIML